MAMSSACNTIQQKVSMCFVMSSERLEKGVKIFHDFSKIGACLRCYSVGVVGAFNFNFREKKMVE